MPTSDELRMLQALPLDLKVRRTQQRIREWVDYWGKDHVYVSFSGGKDSTVLLHIVREMYGDEIPAVFVNTGLEYPEIQKHVRSFSNVVILRPKMNFKEVLTTYGYPVISKEVSNCIETTRAWCSKNLNVERERERERESKAQTLPVRVQQMFGVNKYSGGGHNGRAPDDVMQLLGIGPYMRGHSSVPYHVCQMYGIGAFADGKRGECSVVGSEDVRGGESGDKADKGEYP